MNMYKYNKEIIHIHCVNLYDKNRDKSIFIEGPVITIYNEDESMVIDYLI